MAILHLTNAAYAIAILPMIAFKIVPACGVVNQILTNAAYAIAILPMIAFRIVLAYGAVIWPMMTAAFAVATIQYAQIAQVFQMAILHLTNAAYAIATLPMIAFRIVPAYGEETFLILIMIQYAIILIYALVKMIFLIVMAI